jgi:hypothetical protein
MKGWCLFLKIGAAGLALLAASVQGARPVVYIRNPPSHAIVNNGENVYLRVQTGDSDPGGEVTEVEYYTNGVLLASATAPPFAVWWTNVVGTNIAVRAVAIDNSQERGTSVVVNVTSELPRPRNLTWGGSAGGPEVRPEWNSRDFQWWENVGGTRAALFHPGDTVTIYSWDPIFIGTDGVAMPVSPRSVTSSTTMTLHGGDILTGSLIAATGNTILSNYAGSLSFPGGTVVRQSSFGGLIYNIARAPAGATVHLGTGPITLVESRFQFDLVTNQFATLENDFYLDATTPQSSLQSWLQPAAANASNATAKFTGALNLNGRLNVAMLNGTRQFSMEGFRDTDYHEWAGPIIISQGRNVPTGFFLQGQYRSKGLLLSGNIRDGGGTGTNRLTLQNYAVPVIRITGSNTYAHGTLIDLSPSAPPGWIEVAPGSSLGSGDVEVRGMLRLMGNQNINSNATVNLQQGRVIIDTGVKVRISRLVLGGISYTAGIFSRTNTFGRITSNGTIRVPAVNLLPTVAITSPVMGAAIGAVDPFLIRTEPADQDSYIDRVEFYVDGMPVGTRTNPPYYLSVSGLAVGSHTLQAVAYDDDGGMGSSAPLNITIAPGIDAIRHVETNVVVIEFRAPPGQTLQLEVTDSLTASMWSTLGSFSGGDATTPHRVTNSIPSGVSTRYYRLRSQ